MGLRRGTPEEVEEREPGPRKERACQVMFVEKNVRLLRRNRAQQGATRLALIIKYINAIQTCNSVPPH